MSREIIDLYAVLEVEHGADLETIKQAFRRKAKKLHPDVNGGKQTPEFDELKLAHDTLTNPDARKLYDDFGIVPGQSDDRSFELLQAIKGIKLAFLQVVRGNSVEDISGSDLLGSIRDFVTHQQEGADASLKELCRQEEHLVRCRELLEKKLKIKKKGAKNIFTEVLDTEIRKLTLPRQQQETLQRIYKQMFELLDAFEFKFEPQAKEQSVSLEEALMMMSSMTGGAGGSASRPWGGTTFKLTDKDKPK